MRWPKASVTWHWLPLPRQWSEGPKDQTMWKPHEIPFSYLFRFRLSVRGRGRLLDVFVSALSSRSLFRKPVPTLVGEWRRWLTSSILIHLSAQTTSFHLGSTAAFRLFNVTQRPACHDMLSRLFACCWRWRWVWAGNRSSCCLQVVKAKAERPGWTVELVGTEWGTDGWAETTTRERGVVGIVRKAISVLSIWCFIDYTLSFHPPGWILLSVTSSKV